MVVDSITLHYACVCVCVHIMHVCVCVCECIHTTCLCRRNDWLDWLRTLRHIAIHCNTLQHSHAMPMSSKWLARSTGNTATHCNALQHTATHCNTLQHTAYRLPHIAYGGHWNIATTATRCSILQHTASHRLWRSSKRIAILARDSTTHCKKIQTLKHTAAHCNTLQHTAYGGRWNE